MRASIIKPLTYETNLPVRPLTRYAPRSTLPNPQALLVAITAARPINPATPTATAMPMRMMFLMMLPMRRRPPTTGIQPANSSRTTTVRRAVRGTLTRMMVLLLFLLPAHTHPSRQPCSFTHTHTHPTRQRERKTKAIIDIIAKELSVRCCILIVPILKHVRPHRARNQPSHRPQRSAAELVA